MARSTRSATAATAGARDHRAAPSSPWAVQVGRLRCLRGVDTLTAVGLCAEIGDFERFARAEQLMSYLGLVPSESDDRPATPARVDHQDRLRARPPAAGRGRLALPQSARTLGKTLTDRQTGPATRSGRDRLDRATAAAPHLDPPRGPRQAPHDHRGRGRPRARRVLLGDHPDRVAAQPTTPAHIPSAGSVAARHARGTRDSAMSNPPPRAGHARS